MTTDDATKVTVEYLPNKQVYSELDFSESYLSVSLENCYQTISNGSNSLNKSPYYNSEEGVNGHLKDEQANESRGNKVYQNAWTDLPRDIIANTVNKNQEEEAIFDYLHQDANETLFMMFETIYFQSTFC